MDPRTAAATLNQIASYLELRRESPFKVKAYRGAAAALVALESDDLGELDREGTLAGTRGLGPATLSVVRDLIETGESKYLEQLRAEIPPGLLELLDIPGLSTARIHVLHEQLGVDSVDALEAAAKDGRLAKLKGYGPKTADKLLRGVELFRAKGSLVLYAHALASSRGLLASVRAHPDVVRAEIAGSIRRHRETVRDTDVVAGCRADPRAVATSFARAPGVKRVTGEDTSSPCITFMDGAQLHLHCVADDDFALALWLATGSGEHVRAVGELLAARGYSAGAGGLQDTKGKVVAIPDEATIYALAALPFIPPEMRELGHELTLARSGRMPTLVELADLRGVLHCHSTYSDGKATVAEMAAAARERGWSYIGITDHSVSAFYAGGLSREQVLAQHEEIDALNAASGSDFRILKGIEADILADGALDYDQALLDRFDFVVGSIHSRFSMDRTAMTARVLRALDDPHLTILAHPTGRLLLSREPYAMDMDAVLEKAGALGVAIELNADPKRLDLDWRYLPRALELGCVIEIGPDAHSTRGLDVTGFGVGMARKSGVESKDVLNARSADDVLAFAARRREAR
ncbi:MAG: DNA polymerase/3'-5' exonuclease PolX [Gemmatimonadaceae bacterium]